MSDKSSFFKASYLEWLSAKDDLIRSIISLLRAEGNGIDEEKERSKLSDEINRNGYVERFLKSGRLIHGGISVCNKFTMSVILDKGSDGGITSLNSLGPFDMSESINVVEKMFKVDSGVKILAEYTRKRNVSTITDIIKPDVINNKIIEASSLSMLDPVHLDYLCISFDQVD